MTEGISKERLLEIFEAEADNGICSVKDLIHECTELDPGCRLRVRRRIENCFYYTMNRNLSANGANSTVDGKIIADAGYTQHSTKYYRKIRNDSARIA